MTEIANALLSPDRKPVSEEMWECFWDRLRDGALVPGEAAAVLASLSTSIPEDRTLHALLGSLRRRRRCQAEHPVSGDAVNIVGTGGGPTTFNISTAAALVAAAMGVRVIKTESRAYSGLCGSIDPLHPLGLPLSGSHDETAAMLDRFGIAFAGAYVYPIELHLLSKSILPLPMKVVGRFFNTIGPFLADVPVAGQLTGVADAKLLPRFQGLAAQIRDRRIWLCANRIGADELISFMGNRLVGTGLPKGARAGYHLPTIGPGSPEDLRPAATTQGTVTHFEAILAGDTLSA
jgi:anthranilate phosphoribosyltransferase